MRMLSKTTFWILSVVLVNSLSSNSLRAAEPEPTSAGYRTQYLQNDQLTGWHVQGCEVELKEGVLTAKSGDGFIQTDQRFRDFILEIDYRPLKAANYDSGIYIRCEAPAAGQKWPARHQINLREKDELNLLGFPGGKSQGIVQPREWNKAKVMVVGETVTMEINGKPAWKVDGMKERDGYIGLQVEATEGGAYEFRNIAITELGYQSLFNGTDLTGWVGGGDDAAKCWKVAEGNLVCTGQPGPWLRSEKEFQNFDLRLQYKLKEGGNSGVYVRVADDGNHQADDAGTEVQILDDLAEKHKNLQPYQYGGSVYGIAPATAHVGHPVGQWNTLEIICQGPNYRVIHNGKVIVDAKDADFPALAKRRLQGKLGLQNHSEEVLFRNIRVGAAE